MKDLKIHFLNTIWSDSILLEYDNNFALMDTASKFYYPMVKEHLDQLKIKNIDFILLSHFHSDHYGNVAEIINDYKVNKLYLKHYHGLDGTTSSGYASNEEYIEHEFENYNEIIEAAVKNQTEIIYIDDLGLDNLEIKFGDLIVDVFDIKNTLYDMYSNPNSAYYQQKRFNENFNCAAAFIKYHDYNIFLGADVTCSATDIVELKELSIKMINRIYQKYNINKIHLYKSCHHGGGGTNTKPLCKLINPDYTIITNTARWLDTYDTFQNLKDANPLVEILPTDYQKYIFTINDQISYQKIDDVSLFITLNKN